MRDFGSVNDRSGSTTEVMGTLALGLLRLGYRTLPRRVAMSRSCHDVWPGRAVQDELPRSTNVRAASMYQVSEWSNLLRTNMGIRAHPS
jgi:hypothetical protein